MLARWYASTFEALAVPQFRILWWGSTVASLAFMMTRTVQSVVAFDLAGNSAAVGVVALGSGVTMIFIGPLGGVLADRLSKRRVLLFGQTFVGFCFLTIGLLILTERLTIPLLVLLSATMGLSFSFIGPTRQAYVGEVVPRDLLPNAVALSQLSMGFARVFSPMVAGGLIAWSFSGTGGTYLVMASIFIVVVATLSLLPPSRPASSGRSMSADFVAGIAHVRDRPRLMLLVLSFIVVVIVGMPYVTVLPALLERELDSSTEAIGILFTVEAIGGLITGLAVAGSVRGDAAWRLMLVLGVLFGVALVGLAVAPTLALAMPAIFFMGVGLTGFQLTNNALLMMEAEEAYFGRVMSLVMLAWGGQGLTAFPLGLLADSIGERATLAIEGVIVAVTVVVTGFAYAAIKRRHPELLEPPEPSALEPGGAIAGGS